MNDADASSRRPKSNPPSRSRTPGAGEVLQVERRDYVDLAPTDRARVQEMKGFEACYTDIVDYIVRCTHRIWDERDVGLIYTHYTHNAVLYGALGTLYSREEIVHDTIQRLVTFPERRGMATQVIWRGNDVDGFYTSHLVTGSGRHTQFGHFGKPTGRTFVSRTVADCMILENRIYREWVVADSMAIVRQLGLDEDAIAASRAQALFDKGLLALDIGENRRLLGQFPPEAKPDLSIARSETEAMVIGWLHEIFNRRMFGLIGKVYAPNCQWHGPLMKELYGPAAVLHQTMGLVGSMPDGAFMPQHICSNPCEEGGVKLAVRWIIEGRNTGWGLFGAPTGHSIRLMGMTHLHVIDDKIVDEWTVYDEMSVKVQAKLAELASA